MGSGGLWAEHMGPVVGWTWVVVGNSRVEDAYRLSGMDS